MRSRHDSTRRLLARYAILLNKFGPDSDEANELLLAHQQNADFVELAELSRSLKIALQAPAGDTILDCQQSR